MVLGVEDPGGWCGPGEESSLTACRGTVRVDESRRESGSGGTLVAVWVGTPPPGSTRPVCRPSYGHPGPAQDL